MRINTNISAMNTYSRLTSANNSKSGSLAKLSSGLRINKAGDDAAGLAISEKMRGQIGGLKQATRNAQDAISLIQTAEGGLNETHSILNRMRDLAVQASTGTNTFEDRQEIQNEIIELATELTRISTDTEFNTMKLLNGDRATELTFHIGANENQNLKLTIGDMSASALGVAGTSGPLTKATEAYLGVPDQTVLKSGDDVVAVELGDDTYAAKDIEKVNDGTNDILVVKEGAEALNLKPGITVDGKLGENYTEGKTFIDGLTETTDYAGTEAIKDGDKVTAVKADGKWYAADNVKVKVDSADAKNNKLEVIEGAAELDVKGLAADLDADKIYHFDNAEGGIDITSQASADKAITIIDEAINKVSAERSKLGATQNRLDHTINNLTATAENLSEAESRIRDVDMAEEMMEFTKSNILSQAATAMLAQANQMPQGVLQLLQ